MSSEVWVLIGVLVGAASSFFGQWLLARQKRTDDRAHELRVTQRDVYARFIGAVWSTAQAVTKFVAHDPATDAVFEAFRQANVDLQSRVGEVQLISPPDTAIAAREWSEATLLAHNHHTDSAASAASYKREEAATVEFMRLARRDLGSD